MDLSLTRNFRLSNTQSFELRAEAFNAFNWFQLGQPVTARSSATFGQILTAVNPRVIQLAVKYAF